MTHLQLRKKVAEFTHGVDSHGNLLTPWRHELDCVMCDRLARFIVGLLNDSSKT